MTPAWSPDSRWIPAVQILDGCTAFGLYAFPCESGEPRLILRLNGIVFSAPAWIGP